MRAGQQITYDDGQGGRFGATVVAVVGSGHSGHKRLDVTWQDGGATKHALAVPHLADREHGASFWQLAGELPPVDTSNASGRAVEGERPVDAEPADEVRAKRWKGHRREGDG